MEEDLALLVILPSLNRRGAAFQGGYAGFHAGIPEEARKSQFGFVCHYQTRNV